MNNKIECLSRESFGMQVQSELQSLVYKFLQKFTKQC